MSLPARLISPFLIVLVLAPFITSTPGTWTVGLFAAESDDLVQAVESDDSAVECAPLGVGRCAGIVSSLTPMPDPALSTPASPLRSGRAPPAARPRTTI